MDNLDILLKKFKAKYPSTIAWRVNRHANVIRKHLNPGEKVTYAFAAQKSKGATEIFFSCVVAITNKRLLIGQKRVVPGYFFHSITPDMYNDLEVKSGIIWGNVIIDTVKEVVELSNISNKALDEIETHITEFMMKEKKKYHLEEKIDKTKKI